MTRLPFEPLEAAAAAPSVYRLSLMLGVDRTQVYRWRRYGVTPVQAAELALRLGVRPAAVWPGRGVGNSHHRPRPRLPFDPLRDGRPDGSLAETVGVCRRTIIRWRLAGVPLYQADRAAVLLANRHPGEVWPQWWDLTAC